MTRLNFRREITLNLLRAKPKIHVMPGPRAHQSTSARISDIHYIVTSSQGRCVVCPKNTKNMCFECKKRLHAHYFPRYRGHSETAKKDYKKLVFQNVLYFFVLLVEIPRAFKRIKYFIFLLVRYFKFLKLHLFILCILLVKFV